MSGSPLLFCFCEPSSLSSHDEAVTFGSKKKSVIRQCFKSIQETNTYEKRLFDLKAVDTIGNYSK